MNQPNEFNPDQSDVPEEFCWEDPAPDWKGWDEEKWEYFFSTQSTKEQEDPEELEGLAEEYLEDLPVYQISKGLADEAIEFARTVRSNRKGVRIALEQLMTYSVMICAHVAAGHALGYEKETLGGNIALCRRGLLALKSARQALRQIETHYGITLTTLQLNHLLREVHLEIESWIEELRSQKE